MEGEKKHLACTFYMCKHLTACSRQAPTCHMQYWKNSSTVMGIFMQDLLNTFKVFDTLTQEPDELTRIRVAESIIWFAAHFLPQLSPRKSVMRSFCQNNDRLCKKAKGNLQQNQMSCSKLFLPTVDGTARSNGQITNC